MLKIFNQENVTDQGFGSVIRWKWFPHLFLSFHKEKTSRMKELSVAVTVKDDGAIQNYLSIVPVFSCESYPAIRIP